MLLAIEWDLCSIFFYTACATIGRNLTNHSLEKKKAPHFDLLGSKTTFFPMFSPLKMDNFVLKVKPKKICKLNKLKHEKFSLKNISQIA